MTQEEKQLLLQDICARSPYGVKALINGWEGIIKIHDILDFNEGIKTIKPYLRPMSSITEEERDEVKKVCSDYLDEWENAETVVDRWKLDAKTSYLRYTFYNSHYLDWNGLIEKGLALEATEGMYDNIKTE